MAKWDGDGIEFLKPNMFLPTEYDSSGEIKAAIFFSYYQASKKFYTKAEWHRFEMGTLKNAEAGEDETVRMILAERFLYLKRNGKTLNRSFGRRTLKSRCSGT